MVEMIFENQTLGIKMLGRNCSLQYLNIIYQVQAVPNTSRMSLEWLWQDYILYDYYKMKLLRE